MTGSVLKEDNVQHYAVEVARMLYDDTGLLPCGTRMLRIELQRDQ